MKLCSRECENRTEFGYCKLSACVKRPEYTHYVGMVDSLDGLNMDFHFAQQGWQCPICKRVYSPSTPMCWYCVPQQTTVTTTGISTTNVIRGKDLIDWIQRNDANEKLVYRRMDYGSAEETQVKKIFISDGDYATDAIVID